MGLVLQGAFGETMAPYGREEPEITTADIIALLKQYVTPGTTTVYTYTKAESIALGVQDALVAMFGSVPGIPREISATEVNTLINNALSYARYYYMLSEEVPDWEWPS